MSNETVSTNDDYELVPHKEIQELKTELEKLREFPQGPGAKMQLSMDELSGKVEQLIDIFEEALHSLKAEELGLGWHERLKPIISRLDKLSEQNAEIASALVELADMVSNHQRQLQHSSFASSASPLPVPQSSFSSQQAFRNAPSFQPSAFQSPSSQVPSSQPLTASRVPPPPQQQFRNAPSSPFVSQSQRSPQLPPLQTSSPIPQPSQSSSPRVLPNVPPPPFP